MFRESIKNLKKTPKVFFFIKLVPKSQKIDKAIQWRSLLAKVDQVDEHKYCRHISSSKVQR